MRKTLDVLPLSMHATSLIYATTVFKGPRLRPTPQSYYALHHADDSWDSHLLPQMNAAYSLETRKAITGNDLRLLEGVCREEPGSKKGQVSLVRCRTSPRCPSTTGVPNRRPLLP